MYNFEYLLPGDVEQKYVVKAEEPTDQQYGYYPRKRPIKYLIDTCIINLDKVAGPTSHEVVAWVRKMFLVEKTGHGGTLDPEVVGILPVGINSATRVMRCLLSAGKEYICVMYLHREVSKERIEAALNLFMGPLYQRPPLKSAVARKNRVRTIYYNQLIQVQGQHVLFRVGCESGTYIRKLCFDIGEALCCGAHMLELRRTKTGVFKEDKTLVTLQDLKDAITIYNEKDDDLYLRKILYPMEAAVKHWKKIFIRDTAVDAIAHGAKLVVSGVLYLSKGIHKSDDVAIMTQKGELVALAEAKMTTDQMLKKYNGFCAKPEKVFIPRGMYPSWKDKPEEKIIEE